MDNSAQKNLTLSEMKDKYFGPVGSEERDNYEMELKLDLIGDMIKNTRLKRNLTQEQLGKLIGVNKSEISKLEGNARNMTVNTILKIFTAMNANIIFKVEI